jgi:Outer membrane protein beta-barrel domain
MKKSFLYLLFILPFDLIGQNRSSIGLLFSPNLTYGFNYATENLETSLKYKKLLDSIQFAESGYHIGFAYNYQIKKRLSVRTGFQYAQFNLYEKERNIEIVFNKLTDDGRKINPDTLRKTIGGKYAQRNLQIPVIIRYLFDKRKISAFGEIGLIPNLTISDSDYSSISTYNSFTVLSHIGFGLNYQINKSYSIYMMPNIRYQLYANSVIVKRHLMSVGCEFGFSMNL